MWFLLLFIVFFKNVVYNKIDFFKYISDLWEVLNIIFIEMSGIVSEYWKGVLNLERWKEWFLIFENLENRNVEW